MFAFFVHSVAELSSGKLLVNQLNLFKQDGEADEGQAVHIFHE